MGFLLSIKIDASDERIVQGKNWTLHILVFWFMNCVLVRKVDANILEEHTTALLWAP